MNITRENYEVFFMDYLDGDLEEKHIDQFLDFLEKNPDLKEELHLFENIRLPEDELVFSDKNSLYKNTIYEKEVLDNKYIAYLENDLEAGDRKLFESWLEANPEFLTEYQYYAKTRLVPEAHIVFSAKDKLYQKSGKAIVLNWVARVAAVVVILWGISTVFQMQNQPGQPLLVPEVAEIKLPEKNMPETPELVKNTNQPAVAESRKEVPASTIVRPVVSKNSDAGLAEAKFDLPAETPARHVQSLAEIKPLLAKLETPDLNTQMSLESVQKYNAVEVTPNVLTLDEFLALRAKKVSNEGWLSAQRILRAGLGIASEISGERIGYGVKDGKIASLEFESKLLAFSIPLEKK
ncbi:MAG: hypothetical protein WAO52_07095 [Prolixibacteraceae bacterium]